MQLQAGDYIVWFASSGPIQDIGFFRLGEDLRFMSGDEKHLLYLIKTESDFQDFVCFIADMMNLYVEKVTRERLPRGTRAMYEFYSPAP